MSQEAAAGSQNPQSRGRLLFVRGGSSSERHRGGQKSFGHVKAPPQRRRCISTQRDGGDTGLRVGAPADEPP